MDEKTLKSKKKEELTLIAKGYNIPGADKLKKPELIEKILEADKQADTRNEERQKALDSERLKVVALTKEKKDARDKAGAMDNVVVVGEQKKYELESKGLYTPQHFEQDARELPNAYGEDKIVLMVRDPWWSYAYWEITQSKKDQFSLSSKKIILRVYDITGVSFDGKNAHSFFDIDVNIYAINWYIKFPQCNRSYIVDIGFINDRGEFVLLARSNAVHAPRESVSDLIDDEWMMPGEEAEKIFRLSGGDRITEFLGSEAITRLISKQVESGSAMSSGVLSSASFSSGMMQESRKSKPKSFWLIVDCELIVYGATEPDAHVTIMDKPVELRPDGTFSTRFALPNGKYVIPVKAVNADGDDTRVITPIVTRDTK